MHPFGGTPICPRCSKAVYAAEQIMGPGRKLYHKPCLTCTTCRKRLDSYNLVEHDQEPYCKTCHVKNFGTRDLRHANLPDRDEFTFSPPVSPIRPAASLPPPLSRSPPSVAPPPPLLRKDTTGGPFDGPGPVSPTSALFRPTRTYSPVRPPSSEQVRYSVPPEQQQQPQAETNPKTPEPEKKDDEDWDPPVINGTPSHTGRGAGGLPRTVPLGAALSRTPSPVKTSTFAGSYSAAPAAAATPTPVRTVVSSANGNVPVTPSNHNTTISARMTVPLGSMSTGGGTRYGGVISGRISSPMSPMSTGKQWGGGTPTCAKCSKTVYFAEQVKAIGKIWHRNCLRCTSCNTTLDTGRLTENDGNPYCKHCYGKHYGPAGSGYALLGKAGG